MDLSEKRLCEVRCFGTNDDMSNWAPKPKYMLAEGDTYTKRPDDETYPQLAVNYLKLDHVPLYNESWAPIVEGIRAGNFFGTTGEILFHNWRHRGRRREEHLQRNHRIHVSARFRGVSLERRHPHRPPDHPTHRHNAFRHEDVQDPVRCDRQKVGTLRRVGLSRRWSVASTDRTEAVRISSTYKFLRVRGRLDVLIDAQKIIGIVLRFNPRQPLVVIAVRCANAVFAFAFHHEVYVRASGSIGMQRCPNNPSPRQ